MSVMGLVLSRLRKRLSQLNIGRVGFNETPSERETNPRSLDLYFVILLRIQRLRFEFDIMELKHIPTKS